jgi:hypothetical protein
MYGIGGGGFNAPSTATQRRRNHDEDDDEEEEYAAEGRVLEAWERAYADDRSWEALQEDESGLLRPIDTKTLVHAQYRRCLLQRSAAAAAARIQKGLIRYLYIVIDLSRVTFRFMRSYLFALSHWATRSVEHRYKCTFCVSFISYLGSIRLVSNADRCHFIWSCGGRHIVLRGI